MSGPGKGGEGEMPEPSMNTTTQISISNILSMIMSCIVSHCYLADEDAQKVHGQAPKAVVLDELVQVDGEQLKDQAQVVAEGEEVLHAHDVVRVVRVAAGVQVLQHPHLHPCLHSQHSRAQSQALQATVRELVRSCTIPAYRPLPAFNTVQAPAPGLPEAYNIQTL